MIIDAPKYRGKQEYLLVYAELINAARHRGTLTYQEVAEIMGLPLRGSHMGAETSRLLGEISQEEHEHGRPMLSALVVSTAGSPGAGFFHLARHLGKLQVATPAEEQPFWEQEKEAVYAAWKTVPKPPVP